jgi:hypothetical protein
MAIGGAYYFGTQKGKILLNPTQTPLPIVSGTPTTPTTKPTSDPTADWKIYTNSVYGFTFKYPQDAGQMKETMSGNSDKPLYVIRNNYMAENREKYAVQIAVWDNPEQKTLLSWLQFMKDSQALPLPSENYKISSNYTVDNLPAMKLWEDPVSNGEQPGKCIQACPASDTYFVKGDKTYRILIVYFTEVDGNLANLPDQILSTFKFTK